jgi:hypothetical protein
MTGRREVTRVLLVLRIAAVPEQNTFHGSAEEFYPGLHQRSAARMDLSTLDKPRIHRGGTS